jgi:hypothetical protein
MKKRDTIKFYLFYKERVKIENMPFRNYLHLKGVIHAKCFLCDKDMETPEVIVVYKGKKLFMMVDNQE